MASFHTASTSETDQDRCSRQVDVSSRRPHVYNGYARNWDLAKFTKQILDGELSHIHTNFRIGASVPSSSSSTCQGKTIRENECELLRASFHQFNSWMSGDCKPDSDLGMFRNLPLFEDQKVFAYADYKHFIELFSKRNIDDDTIEENVTARVALPNFGDWEGIGLMGVDSSQCTLWLGSAGAHTVSTS